MEKVQIGQITAPVGIKGEIRVFPYTDRESRFSDIKKVFVGEGDLVYTIKKVRFDKGMAIVLFDEIKDRNTAETLRGKNLYVDKDTYELDEDSYFLDDILGMSVYSQDGILLGILNDVIQYSYQDLYQIEKTDGKTFLVPAVKEFISDVDIENKKMTIHVIDGLID